MASRPPSPIYCQKKQYGAIPKRTAPFIKNLYKLLMSEDEGVKSAIRWTDDRHFKVDFHGDFKSRYPKALFTCEHGNFLRTLIEYGFVSDTSSGAYEYRHKDGMFVKHKPSLLVEIIKPDSQPQDIPTGTAPFVKALYNSLSSDDPKVNEAITWIEETDFRVEKRKFEAVFNRLGFRCQTKTFYETSERYGFVLDRGVEYVIFHHKDHLFVKGKLALLPQIKGLPTKTKGRVAAPETKTSVATEAPSNMIISRSMATKKRVDGTDNLTLVGVRQSLIRQEDSLIFSLLQRAQYCHNVATYEPNAFPVDGFHGSLVEYIVQGTEKLHAQVGRYSSPDEVPFFPDVLPEPVLPPLHYPQVLHSIANSINVNRKVWDMYFRDILPRLVKEGDDGNFGSTAVCDAMCLQALSKTIHYGKFVAECKFRLSQKSYEAIIRDQDREKLIDMIYTKVDEEASIERIEMKAKSSGQEKPELFAEVYREFIMPMEKQVEVDYLLRRLD